VSSSRRFTDSLVNALINNRALSLLLLIVVLAVVMSVAFGGIFFSWSNLSGILLNLVSEAILAVGMMYLIVSGVIDLSIGANLALGGAIAGICLKGSVIFGIVINPQPVPLAILWGLVASCVGGLLNGLLVARVGVNALIATLAMSKIIGGAALYIGGSEIANLPESFTVLSQTRLLGFFIPVYDMVAIVVIGGILLAKMRYFRRFYFIGGNIRSARLSGINVTNTLTVMFTIMGLLAGLAGIIFAARMGNASGNTLPNIELNVITAAIIGGGSLSGGKGNVAGAFMGVLFINLIKTSMVIAGIDIYWQPIIVGAILIGAVVIDIVLQARYGASINLKKLQTVRRRTLGRQAQSGEAV
jgi:ribose/xylose/arabinose/galactoside ABC-type transport system permease subunit